MNNKKDKKHIYLSYRTIRKALNIFNEKPTYRKPITASMILQKDKVIIGNKYVGFILRCKNGEK